MSDVQCFEFNLRLKESGEAVATFTAELRQLYKFCASIISYLTLLITVFSTPSSNKNSAILRWPFIHANIKEVFPY